MSEFGWYPRDSIMMNKWVSERYSLPEEPQSHSGGETEVLSLGVRLRQDVLDLRHLWLISPKDWCCNILSLILTLLGHLEKSDIKCFLDLSILKKKTLVQLLFEASFGILKSYLTCFWLLPHINIRFMDL